MSDDPYRPMTVVSLDELASIRRKIAKFQEVHDHNVRAMCRWRRQCIAMLAIATAWFALTLGAWLGWWLRS